MRRRWVTALAMNAVGLALIATPAGWVPVLNLIGLALIACGSMWLAHLLDATIPTRMERQTCSSPTDTGPSSPPDTTGAKTPAA